MLKKDQIYKLKNAKDDSEFKEVYVVAETATLVVVKSTSSEKEASVKLDSFTTNYEEKGFEDLSDKEKVDHVYTKSTYALTALQEFSRGLPEASLSNPNLAILNNALHELVLLSSPVLLPSAEAYRESLKTTEPVFDDGIDFLDIENEVA